MTPTGQSLLREFKIYDDSRPSDWTALIGPTQCAALFKDLKSSSPLSPTGSPVVRLRDTTFLLFEHVADARKYCENLVQSNPSVCCEIFDSSGRAKPPFLTIVHPSRAKQDESTSLWLRHSKTILVLSALIAIPLFIWDWYSGGSLVLPTIVGINLIVLGLRFLYWSFSGKEQKREQERRLEEHLRREAAQRVATHKP